MSRHDEMDLLNLDPSKLKLFTIKPRTPRVDPAPQPPPKPAQQIQPKPDIIIEVQPEPIQAELKSLYIPYAVFLFAMGTSNILTLDSNIPIDTSLVCSLLSPLPFTALSASAVTSPFPYLNLLTASLIPLQCHLWSPIAFAPFALLLALTILLSSKKSPVVHAAAALILPSTALIFYAPRKYGVTLTLTVLAVLCMMTSAKISYKVKQVL